jgi:hypothetical protein
MLFFTLNVYQFVESACILFGSGFRQKSQCGFGSVSWSRSQLIENVKVL